MRHDLDFVVLVDDFCGAGSGTRTRAAPKGHRLSSAFAPQGLRINPLCLRDGETRVWPLSRRIVPAPSVASSSNSLHLKMFTPRTIVNSSVLG